MASISKSSVLQQPNEILRSRSSCSNGSSTTSPEPSCSTSTNGTNHQLATVEQQLLIAPQQNVQQQAPSTNSTPRPSSASLAGTSHVHSALANLYLLEARRHRQTLALLSVTLVLYVLMLLPSYLLDILVTTGTGGGQLSHPGTQAQLSVVFFWTSLNIGIVCPLIFLAGDPHFSCLCPRHAEN